MRRRDLSEAGGSGEATRAPGEDRFVRRVASGAAIAVAVVAAAALAVFAADVLLLFFAGVLVAVFLRGLAGLLERHSPLGPRGSLAVVALAIVAVPVLLGWLVWPGIPGQFHAMAAALPDAVSSVRQRLADVPWLQPIFDGLPGTMETARSVDVLGKVTGFFSTTLGGLANVLVVVVIGAYLASDPRLYLRGIVALVPDHSRERVLAVLREAGTTLGWWLAGKAASMAIVGVLTAIGLALLDVPLAIPLALVAAMLTFVPNIGPVLGLAPALLLALAESGTLALYVILLYGAVQFVESYLLTPLIQRRMVSLPPALSLAAQVLAGVMLGALGLLLAAPLAVVTMVLVRRFYLEDVLGKPQDVMTPE